MNSSRVDGKQLKHDYPYDPTYGYDLDDLLSIEAPSEPEGFETFWTQRYERALNHAPKPELKDSGKTLGKFKLYSLVYSTTDGYTLAGWALLPIADEIRRGFVVGHGYGGRDAPDPHLPFDDAALLFPCSRGISLSKQPDLPSEPDLHVVHQIHDPDRYLIGGCVDDLWIAVTALLKLFPETQSNVNLLGISFSGGINSLAAPWDKRIHRVHSNVPTFGHQPLRMKLATAGSGHGVQKFERLHPGVAERTLSLFDAANSARHMKVPTHLACARFDPAVAPPGQFAIYNALPKSLRQLFTLTAGHHEYPEQNVEDTLLLRELCAFFKTPAESL